MIKVVSRQRVTGVLVLAACLGGGSAFAQGPIATQSEAPSQAPTTVTAAAQEAITSNPEVQAAWNRFLAAEDEQSSARGSYFPQVDLGGSIGHERHEIDRTGQYTDYNIAGVNLTITQLLFDGFATSSNVARLGRAKREAYFRLVDAAERIALEAVRAYEDVSRYQRLVALAEDNVARHKDVRDRILKRVEAGVGRQVDSEQATGRLALAESNLVVERSNLHDVSVRYQRIVGSWPAPNLQPAQLSEQPLPENIVNALEVAYSNHPALAAATESIHANREQYRNRKGAYYPRLDLRLRGEHGDDIDRILGQSTDGVAEVVLNYNLFSGGRDRYAVKQAEHQISEAEERREQTCREVRQVLRIAYNDHDQLGDRLAFREAHRDTTAKSRDAYLDQFQIGQRTLLDLLDTENEYFEAQRAYVNDSFDHSIASARTLAGMGKLRPAIGISRKDLPSLDSLGGEETDHGRPCPAIEPMPPEPEPAACVDADGDGVCDTDDLCPNTEPGVPVDGAGCAFRQEVVLEGVKFRFDKDTLTEPSKAILDNAARILNDNPEVQVEVAGHTDNWGSYAYNINLSDRRAASVVRYLVSQGVTQDRLTSKGYGFTQPKTSNETPEGRAINRRVEFRIQSGGDRVKSAAEKPAAIAPTELDTKQEKNPKGPAEPVPSASVPAPAPLTAPEVAPAADETSSEAPMETSTAEPLES